MNPPAGDDLEQRDAESLARVVDHDNLAARDDRAVHNDVDRIADPLVKRDDRAARQLHEARDRERRRSEHDLHRDRDRENRAEIGGAGDGLPLRWIDSARRLGGDGGFVHGLMVLLESVGVEGDRRRRRDLRRGFVRLCDRALDLETVAAVRLAEFAGEHSSA